ncbi:hypothetical protein L207DRAFT_522596 [Hyaloscypha variabilis F]|uniref:Uncharacterized protein n=1 Tax=Hyaloscypha variabilis (strain UAMH 11265 / GT02V1 / F) TaxID=1149755 RepID=A0A2J6S8R2_HYAVF|nr:hypothetical protein L207DRAFT_522596 [Hyaloscypha variabilis F]
MPTQRPFFANFLAAFRAHSAIQQGKATSSPSSPSQHQAHTHTSSPSQPRSITTSAKPSGATTTALSALHSPRTHSTSPLSRSPGPATSPGAGVAAAEGMQNGRYIPNSRGRRGSDSSSEGFRDVLGAEKWYIGGRTATGEERYFKLGVVRRQTSRDRLSLDRLSL